MPGSSLAKENKFSPFSVSVPFKCAAPLSNLPSFLTLRSPFLAGVLSGLVTITMEESISLEETNKIRISLGLKPLVDDKQGGDDKEKQAEDNYAKKRQSEAQAKESK